LKLMVRNPFSCNTRACSSPRTRTEMLAFFTEAACEAINALRTVPPLW
jgi:hypothetical protein